MRPKRVEIAIDLQLEHDLRDIGDDWDVPMATAAYWLLRGLIADARGDRLIVTGQTQSERLARWLVRKFPEEVGVGKGTTKK